MHLDVLSVECLEGAIAGLLKEDGNGHDFAGMQPRGTPSSALACGQEFTFPTRFKRAPEGIHRTKQGIQVGYTHTDTSPSGMISCDNRIIPVGRCRAYPEFTLG